MIRDRVEVIVGDELVEVDAPVAPLVKELLSNRIYVDDAICNRIQSVTIWIHFPGMCDLEQLFNILFQSTDTTSDEFFEKVVTRNEWDIQARPIHMTDDDKSEQPFFFGVSVGMSERDYTEVLKRLVNFDPYK